MDTMRSLIAVTLIATSFWGCATIMTGTSQKIGVTSMPTNARVSVDGQDVGVTPLFANLKRSRTHIISIEMPGYLKTDIAVNKKINGWVWGNIVFGGLIGLIVDATTGSLYSLTPDQIQEELTKGNVKLPKDNCIMIATVLNPDSNWHKIGELKKQLGQALKWEID